MASQIPQPPPFTPQAPPPMAAPAPKKTSPWVWVAAGCGGLIVITILAVAVGGYFAARKIKSVVGDGKNPALTAIKIVAMVNPDLEIVDQDDAAGTVTVRDRKSGKTITVNAEDIKHGKLSFTDEKGESVTIEGNQGEDGSPGSLKIKSGEGEATFGAGAGVKAPEWIPMYPGAKPEATFSATSGGGQGGAFGFKTHDSAATVVDFYKRELERSGFEVSTTKFGASGHNGGIVTGSAAGAAHKLSVMIGEENGETTVTVTYEMPAAK